MDSRKILSQAEVGSCEAMTDNLNKEKQVEKDGYVDPRAEGFYIVCARKAHF